MRIGVDLGGTKIEAIALDETGGVLVRRRVATPSGDYAGTLAAIRDLVLGIEGELGGAGTVGVGTPGTLSARTGRMINCNSLVLNGTALPDDLAEVLGRSVRIENDANCFALSEASDGAGVDGRVVFGVILGTGVGAGIVVGRELMVGRNHIAGEWGHTPLPWSSDEEVRECHCYCGRHGCIERFLCGQGLARDYRTRFGQEIEAAEIAERASRGEAQAREVLELYRDRLARSLAVIVDILDPDVIVLGGGLSNIEALYADLGARISRYAFSDGIETPVVPARHGDSSGVRGAAWLWPASSGQPPR